MSGDSFGPAMRGGRPRRGGGAVRPLRKGTGGGPATKSPARARPSRTRRHARPARWLGTALVVVAVFLAGLAGWATLQLDTESVDGLASTRFGEPTNVLIVGSDSRQDMTREEQLELSTGSEGGDLADTIILLSMRGNDAALLAFPRDLYVERCDGSTGRINASVNIRGPSCLVETVSALSGLPVHHYLETRFLGFVDIVDAVGGVELCLDQPIADRRAGLDLPEGCQVLDGADALGYVRVRAIDDDFGRMERQQRFLGALAGRVASPSTLVNPIRLTRLAHSGPQAVTASDSVGPLAMARIGWGVRSLSGGATTEVVPANPATIGGAAVLEPSGEAAQVFERFRSGAALEEAPDSDPIDGG
ncbi:LytR family transcriptional regulator [Egibacter rhizosphaerae]|uniref:LytR family transcriptional regulator n=1 Tax=Egibacter rhizosphaerae TaxID=1670831 RepID=A0A411YJS1_9ACTN|nr:LCP family protein [Egibacter rhizosphaerae]QBI21448.1 LytR family transcriptional regulator [Egibacter rhizosphaerae]